MSTYLRQIVTADVQMMEHRGRYSIAPNNYPFARHDAMRDVHDGCTISTAVAGPTVVGYGDNENLPTAQFIASDLNTFICRPYVSTATAGNYWNVSPAGDVDLVEETGKRWGLTWTRQRNMKRADAADYVASEWVSKYTLAPNPFILVGIRRPGRPEGCSVEPFTEVHIGEADGKGWALQLPYGDAATWYELVGGQWVQRDWTHGSHHIPEGAEGEEQEIILMISVVRGALGVSLMGDGAGDNYAWYRAGEHVDDWIWVDSAPIRIRHYPGELSVLAQPLYMTSAWVTGEDFWVGVDYGDADASYYDEGELKYRLNIYGWGYSVGADGYGSTTRCAYETAEYDAGAAYVSVPDHGTNGLPDLHCRWRLHLSPYEHTSTFTHGGHEVTVKSYTSPGMMAVRLDRMAVLTDNGEPAVSETVTDRVHSIAVDFGEDFEAVEARIRVHNRPENSYWAKDIGLLRGFRIVNHRWRGYYAEYPKALYPAEWTDEAGTVTSLLEYVWALEPELEGYFAELPGLDLMAILNLQRVKGQIPVGDGWNVRDYVRHILGVARIGGAWQDLEDTGLSLAVGRPEEPAWQPERGRRLGEYLRQVVEKGSPGGAIWAERGQIVTGCKYCGTARTSSDWLQHQDNGWLSSACLAADLARNASGIDLELFCNPEDATDPTALGQMTQVRAYYQTLDDEVFANWVDVMGEDEDGRPLHYVAWDYDSINTPAASNYAGGWVIDHVETSPELKTAGQVARRGMELKNKLTLLPRWFTGTIIADGSLLRGYVVSVKGGQRVGLHNVKARVAQISLPIVRDRVPYVRIKCRVIGTVA